MSPRNVESTHRPPGITVLTSTPLETVGSASGPARNDLIVASQVPSSAARILCSAVGFGMGRLSPSWAFPDAEAPSTAAATQRRARDFGRFIVHLLCTGEQ